MLQFKMITNCLISIIRNILELIQKYISKTDIANSE